MTEAPIKLAGYFLEWQLIEDAKADLADKSKDLFKVMKDEGYDTKAARAVFREKRAELTATSEDVAKAEEAEAIQDLYRAALDSGLTARAGRAREALTSQSDGDAIVAVTGKAQLTNAAGVEPSPSETNSQSAETLPADKPEATPSPQAQASGTLSKREYSEDEIPGFLKQSGRAA